MFTYLTLIQGSNVYLSDIALMVFAVFLNEKLFSLISSVIECLLFSEISMKGGKNYYSCGICSKSYTGAKSLKRHMAVHTGEGFKCNQCTKIFARRDHLRKHLQRVHSIKDIDVVMNTISLKVSI